MTTIHKTTKTQSKQSTTSTQAAPLPVNTPVPGTPAPAPDPNAALEVYVTQTVSALDTVEVELGSDPPLTPAQKVHAAKLRKGGEKIVSQIGNLVTQQQLDSTALPVSDMLAAIGKADALQPLASRLAAFSKHVEDVIFLAQSTAVTMAQQYYALLKEHAKTDTELAAALEPVQAFFAHKSVKAPGAPTKPQRKATKKALNTLKKNAPELLAPTASSPQDTPPAATPAPATTATTHS